ncbi:hypothetical protein LMG3412_00937 [Achromobacter deleyi]|nr:hypothetical protein LMG3412_00937 [Achromobacter deleyi]
MLTEERSAIVTIAICSRNLLRNTGYPAIRRLRQSLPRA